VSVCDGVSRHIQCLALVCVYVCVEAEGRSVALECASQAGSANGVFVWNRRRRQPSLLDSLAGNLWTK